MYSVRWQFRDPQTAVVCVFFKIVVIRSSNQVVANQLLQVVSRAQEGYILFGLPGSRQQKFLVLRFFDIKEQQVIDRVSWFDRYLRRFILRVILENQVLHKVSNDDTAVTQRRLEEKQPEEKINTNCLVKEQEKEYQTGWKIKTGNVLDFFNQRSTQQCTKSRVAKHLGVAVIQQQNGLVKETNVTLLAKVHCFLIQSGLPKTFWAEATCTTAYLINRSPSTAIEKKTPMEMWSGYPSDYGMLRTFGCVAYSHVQQGKLEPRAIKEGIEGVQKPRYKARLVARGFTRRVCIDYNEVFSSVVRYTSIRVILALTACKDFELEQLDVKTAFLHGNLEEVIYMRQPPGYEQVQVLQQKLVQTLVEGHSIQLLEGSLSGDCDVEKNGKWSCIYAVRSQEYQMVCTRPGIASTDALLTTEAGYMTSTKAWKKKMWLKGLLTESRYELRLVAGIATGVLVKGGSRSEVPA
uniref:Retrovirus-related Pol polyprotein from transposon TNT 1-94 n=1 Tax=Tanacetum cinerariifolium TaxID=118510 RepID=A0A6L2JT07_TANCI|nr:retrovirus-related Pol polyprotein from transposon TNT 1-94 [Tanacetum cinerariifolium]